MIQIDKIRVDGFEAAFRGMRNPLESWGKSDSYFGLEDDYSTNVWDVADDWVIDEIGKYEKENEEVYKLRNQYMEWLFKQGILREGGDGYDVHEVAYLGPKDLNLAQRLLRAGKDHSKFLRQITISMDIMAPLYWWKEMDTYKIGTTANSTSTMHKIASKPFTKEMFSFDTVPLLVDEEYDLTFDECIDSVIRMCEKLRQRYLETKDKRYWRALVQLLPESWNQTRTWTANYQVLQNIYFARRDHKLDEWHEFCDMIREDLPYGYELITFLEEEDEDEEV